MVSVANKKRIINIFVGLSIIIFAIAVITIILRTDDNMVPYKSELLENIVTLKGVDLLYIIDNSTYVSLKSKTGSANIVNYNFNLQHLNINYKSPDYSIDAFAERGNYISQRFVKAYDNITGYMDNMTFKTGANGIFEYDYKKGKGNIFNNITVMQGTNSISSDTASFDVNNNYIFFKDNVTVYYVPEER